MKVRNMIINTSPHQHNHSNETNSESVESLSVFMMNKDSRKKISFKVKIFTLFMNEPLLVLCLEDISLFSKIKFLKEK